MSQETLQDILHHFTGLGGNHRCHFRMVQVIQVTQVTPVLTVLQGWRKEGGFGFIKPSDGSRHLR
jgi:hypothetical protein